MGSAHQTFLMIFTLIMISSSLQSSLLMISHAASLDPQEEYITVQETQDSGGSMEKIIKIDQAQNKKVSGEDEDEQKQGLVLQKFRALLDLKGFISEKPPNGELSSSLSPSPSPSPSPSIDSGESPAPSLRTHSHSHSHRAWSGTRLAPQPHEVHKRKKEKSKKGLRKIIVPVLVSAAAGIALVACVLGILCFCLRHKKQRKKPNSTVHVKKKGNLRFLSSQGGTASKVSINPTLDFLSVNTLGVHLEHQQESADTSQNHLKDVNFRGLHQQEVEIKPEDSESVFSSSWTKEVVSVHEEIQIVGYELDGGNSVCADECPRSVGYESNGEKIITEECHSSDDESFHSFADSQLSNVRLSDASAGSSSESPANCSQNEAMVSKSPPRNFNKTMEKTNQPLNAVPPPPPPPPPPLPTFAKGHIRPFSGLKQKFHIQSAVSRRESSDLSNASLSNVSPPPCPPTPPLPKGHFRPISSSSPNSQPDPTASDSSRTSPVTNNSSPLCPPPPPLPPPPKTHYGFTKGPSPPPSQFSQNTTALGKDGAPLPKLKPLHWDKVRAAPDRSMVWDKLRTSSFELDEEMIESLFGYTIQNSTKNEESRSKTPSPGKHVLEQKRLQNITILLKALNASSDHVCNALLKGEGLCLQQQEALVKMAPTKEEESKLLNYKGDVNELGFAEKFVWSILTVHFAFLRAEAMLYRATFEDEVVHLRNSFSMLEEACKELKSSRLFLKLLETVLKTGNRMNVGTIRGGARAFKLDALLKLSDVKGTDGKTSLLHFVVQEISRSEGIKVSDSIMGRIMIQNQTKSNRTMEEKEEDYRRMGLELVSGLNTELYNVKKTATIDLDVLASSVSNLYDGLDKIRILLYEKLSDDEKNGDFLRLMGSFVQYAEKSLKELREDERRVFGRVREITEYFHGDLSKDEVNPLRIFVIVRDFLGMLDHVCKELRSLRVPSSPNPLAPFR